MDDKVTVFWVSKKTATVYRQKIASVVVAEGAFWFHFYVLKSTICTRVCVCVCVCF